MRCALLGLLALVLLASVAARADLYVWVDEQGRTHVTDDVEAVPEAGSSRGGRFMAAERGGGHPRNYRSPISGVACGRQIARH